MPSKRVSLTDEEIALLQDIRAARIREQRSAGGRFAGSELADKVMDGRPVNRRGNPNPKRTELTNEARIRGGKSLQEKAAKVRGIEAITKEIERRSTDGEGMPELQAGDLRPDDVCEVTSQRVGVISDLHWPFHALHIDGSKTAYGPYMTAIEHLRDQAIGTLVINGDGMDCYNVSTHERLERKRNFSWELDVARGMLNHLREYFGDKVRIIYREGNHEERWQRYLARQADQMQDMPEVHLSELLKLRSLGIEWVGERSKLTVGKLWIDHGHEWFGSGGVNPARAYRMKAQDNILVGHVHKTTFDMHKRPLDGSVFAGWSMGCLCDLNPHYAPRNHWNHGVVVVDLDKSGEFTVNNRIIINGRVR